jgi:hypothetical protein
MRRWKIFYLINICFYALLIVAYYINLTVLQKGYNAESEDGLSAIIWALLVAVLEFTTFIPLVLLSVIVLIYIGFAWGFGRIYKKPIVSLIILMIATLAESIFLFMMTEDLLAFNKINLLFILSVALLIYQIVMAVLKSPKMQRPKGKTEKPQKIVVTKWKYTFNSPQVLNTQQKISRANFYLSNAIFLFAIISISSWIFFDKVLANFSHTEAGTDKFMLLVYGFLSVFAGIIYSSIQLLGVIIALAREEFSLSGISFMAVSNIISITFNCFWIIASLGQVAIMATIVFAISIGNNIVAIIVVKRRKKIRILPYIRIQERVY